ncbi:hypothetical protein ABIB82_006434 [Bradyrhizobium sp. i1.8.4]|uniref:hypothetical protein n=1 Tax=unclassified Bradyrhizobium TaxID=2631580 RepID=UPI003D1EF4B2
MNEGLTVHLIADANGVPLLFASTSKKSISKKSANVSLPSLAWLRESNASAGIALDCHAVGDRHMSADGSSKATRHPLVLISWEHQPSLAISLLVRPFESGTGLFSCRSQGSRQGAQKFSVFGAIAQESIDGHFRVLAVIDDCTAGLAAVADTRAYGSGW